ncbi:sulfotransferase [Thioclava sp. FR2]|uniref:sulfotransferase n=1 Tax=Thioclava sp. FR2 TaxID=3445780 RepID=UPI003EBAE0CE
MSVQVKVIAISGSGRSGSTLLGLLLSQTHGTFNLGQARHLWSAWGDDAPCSCGNGLKQCTVYGTLVSDLLSSSAFATPRAAHVAGNAFFNDAAAVTDWSDKAARQKLAARHAHYLALLRNLLVGLQQKTGASCFVDSSKTPEMALAFSMLDEVDFYVVNLLRDPRAVACSWYKKSPRLLLLWKNMRIWRNRQIRLGSWAAALPGRFAELKYEDFAKQPRDKVSELVALCRNEDTKAFFTGPDTVNLSWENQHLFPPANEAVLSERKEKVRITPAESWRSPQNAKLHRLAMLATWPVGRKYYPERL